MKLTLKIVLLLSLVLAATSTETSTESLLEHENNLFIEQNSKAIEFMENLVNNHYESKSLTADKARQMISLLTNLQNDLIAKAEANAQYFQDEHGSCINTFDKYKCFKSKAQEKNLKERSESLNKLKKDYLDVKYSIQNDQDSIEKLKTTYQIQQKQNQHRIDSLEQQVIIVKKVKALIQQRFNSYVFSQLYQSAEESQLSGKYEQFTQISEQIKQQSKELFKESAFDELLKKIVDQEENYEIAQIPILIQKSCQNTQLTNDIYATVKKVNQIITACLVKNEQIIKQLRQENEKSTQYQAQQVKTITAQIAKNTAALNKLKLLIDKLQQQVNKIKDFLKQCRGNYENNDACKDEIKFASLYIKQTQALIDKIGLIIQKIIQCLAKGENIAYKIPQIKKIKFRCPKGYYQHHESCLKCEKNCKTCTSSTYCTQCNAGFQNINYKCYPKCGYNEKLVGYTCVCKEGFERIPNGQCAAKCGKYQVRKGNACSCVSGFTMVNGVCVRQCGANTVRNPKTKDCECKSGFQISVNGYDCIPECGPNKVRMANSNDCDCKINFIKIENQCYQRCRINEQRVGYVCQCKPEYERVNGICIPACKQNQIRINGKCICKPGFEYSQYDQSGRCYPICQQYQFRNKENQCECQKNYDFITQTGQCLEKCGLHQVRNSYHRCVCEKNFESINGKCVKSCNGAYEYRNMQTLQCDCIPGYKSVHDVCIKIQCNQYEELVNGKCVQNCGPYSTRIDGYCVCQNDYEMIGRTCTKKCGLYQVRVEIAENKYACQCDDGYDMISGKCLISCKEDQYRSPTNGECYQCPNYCRKCSNAKYCQVCDDGYKLGSDGYCYDLYQI